MNDGLQMEHEATEEIMTGVHHLQVLVPDIIVGTAVARAAAPAP